MTDGDSHWSLLLRHSKKETFALKKLENCKGLIGDNAK